MDFITNWVKNLIFVVLFTSFLELFLPENNMRKYVRIIMGFFIITVLISPLAMIINNDFSGVYNIFPLDDEIQKTKWENIKSQGEEIKTEHQSYLDEYYKKELTSRINNIVSLDFPDIAKTISLELNREYQIKSININLHNKNIEDINITPVEIDKDQEKKKKSQEEKKNKINSHEITQLKRRLSQVFQVPVQSINIKSRGET